MEADAESPALGAWAGYTKDRDQVLLVVFPAQVWVVTASDGQRVWPRNAVRVGTSAAGLDSWVSVEPAAGRSIRFTADRAEARAEISAALSGDSADGVEADTSLTRARVVTLSDLPGHRITKVHGVVSGVGSLSGWTAADKGRGAVDKAFPDLLASARRLGANAVIGLHGSPFGAGGGITNMLGGDAVGVLLIGTAVTAELIVDPPEPS
jgi:uncharacterized protein YbjQ (UPF0145 family)